MYIYFKAAQYDCVTVSVVMHAVLRLAFVMGVSYTCTPVSGFGPSVPPVCNHLHVQVKVAENMNKIRIYNLLFVKILLTNMI